jgi:hypothetical protein
MNNILIVFVLLILFSENALAGSDYDKCIKEEKTLIAQEASECHGLRYLLNPSACYATQKALKEYKAGKCKDIGSAEGVDFTVKPVIPEKKTSIGNTAEKAGSVNTDIVNSFGSVSTVPVKKSTPETPQQEPTLEQLKEENARLKAEVSRLTSELEQFGKACH